MPRSGAVYPKIITESFAEILDMDAKARGIARTMQVEKNEEQVELAVKSSDKIHRIAAAFYFQFKNEPNSCLINLLADEDPLVIEAAKQALVIIANDSKFRDQKAYPKNHAIDFGPWMFGPGKRGLDRQNPRGADFVAVRRDAIELWQSHFDQVARNQKLVEKVGNSKGKVN